MADLRYEVEHGLKGKGDNVTLNEWFDTWLNVHKKRTIKESTQVRYQDAYRRYIKPSLGKKRIADLNPLVIDYCKEWLMKITARKPFKTFITLSMQW